MMGRGPQNQSFTVIQYDPQKKAARAHTRKAGRLILPDPSRFPDCSLFKLTHELKNYYRSNPPTTSNAAVPFRSFATKVLHAQVDIKSEEIKDTVTVLWNQHGLKEDWTPFIKQLYAQAATEEVGYGPCDTRNPPYFGPAGKFSSQATASENQERCRVAHIRTQSLESSVTSATATPTDLPLTPLSVGSFHGNFSPPAPTASAEPNPGNPYHCMLYSPSSVKLLNSITSPDELQLPESNHTPMAHSFPRKVPVVGSAQQANLIASSSYIGDDRAYSHTELHVNFTEGSFLPQNNHHSYTHFPSFEDNLTCSSGNDFYGLQSSPFPSQEAPYQDPDVYAVSLLPVSEGPVVDRPALSHQSEVSINDLWSSWPDDTGLCNASSGPIPFHVDNTFFFPMRTDSIGVAGYAVSPQWLESGSEQEELNPNDPLEAFLQNIEAESPLQSDGWA